MCFNELAYLTTRYLVNTPRAVRLDVCLSSKRGERLEKRTNLLSASQLPPLGKGARESGSIMQERIRGLINPDRLMRPLIADRRITETKRDKFWDHSCERAERTHAPLSLRSKHPPTHTYRLINGFNQS